MLKLWFILAVLTALAAALKDVFSKIAVTTANPYLVAWAWSAGALPFLLPLLLVIDLPPLGPRFWPALFAGGLLHIGATILYIKALKASDLSLTIPMITLTPLFLLVTSPLMLGELPSAASMTGIILIVVGSYLLNIHEYHKGFLEPFRALVREPGPRLMLGVALIWSVTANIDKIGITGSSPLAWVIAVDSFVAVAPIVWLLSPAAERRLSTMRIRKLAPIGLSAALVLILQMHAIQLTLVPYVIAIKRTSVLFSILFGLLVFGEKRIRERLLGAAIMVVGVVIIAMFSCS
ncbi:MAG: EamA family transporter [Deltaproteobacteria bacterium]|nr:EamA family transporter [Candidatus Anaeroferrophillus wilburensis]MBN2888235.1 EamA family transporter [Deltaproteobacteria bacterium]